MVPYGVLADAVLVLHTAFVAFVVLGLVLTAAGGPRGWAWVRNPWFRALHLCAIVFVVVQTWLGFACPLTVLENALRARAGQAIYAPDGFIAHWLQNLLYYEAPAWVFATCYTAVAGLVIWVWVRYPPARVGRTH